MCNLRCFLLCLLACLASVTNADEYHPRVLTPRLVKSAGATEEKTAEYWVDKAQSIIADKLEQTSELNTNRAKNIILFLGDGMSVHTITATRAFLGDSSEQVSFEQFPYTGLSKTYSVDKRVPDSACTATAYLSGVKANYGTIGVTAEVPKNDCEAGIDSRTHTESIAKWAQDAGKWAGLVTTAHVTHASPAGVYAHTANRAWETDAKIKDSGCESGAGHNVDIATQLLEWPVGKNLRVIMGGGRRNFIDQQDLDEEGIEGRRSDGRNLTEEWLADKHEQCARASYVWNKEGLQNVDLDKTEYLLGLFSSSHCPYHGDLEREGLTDKVPSLSEMTEAAIQLLSNNKKGYFLFVEGARIDMAHHSSRAHLSLEDTAEFARAIDLARKMTDEEDTLIVVTSDHSHTMTINGYPTRGSDIFGLAPITADDNLPYTILSYANGPGYSKTYSKKSGRRDLSKADLDDPKYRYMATVPLDSETHGGDDVGVFASGPYAHYFSGNYEQTNIPALMAYAADIGPFAKSAIGVNEVSDDIETTTENESTTESEEER
ncbi:membrane-bound alkaline phosphatase [Zeugodacus cucurbitae]|uniref:membrane-bound alkaline phosphatase n=1 Tax=Zeugodacus cucurbitae TaxID=28588 RepID=UPI0023D90AB0|nr:membrane-bound alkaline phosphatase [Zeugodacus cucurbitae]